MDGYKHLKFIVLIVAIVVTVVGCNDSVEPFDSTRTVTAPSASPLPANGNSNSGTIPYLATSVNIEERRTWAEASKAFEAVPAEFRTVDFANFRFPFGKLTNGELVIESRYGADTYLLDWTFYLDLFGDEVKEAIVSVCLDSCGGSCDGGACTLFFFQSSGAGPKRVGQINFGSRAYGCSAKSITIRNEVIEIEQFGKCLERGDRLDQFDAQSYCKFCVAGITSSTYQLTPAGPQQLSITFKESPQVNVMNYPTEIRIRE